MTLCLCRSLYVREQAVQLSLKASAVVGEFVHKINFETIKEGMKVRNHTETPVLPSVVLCNSQSFKHACCSLRVFD